MAIERKPSPLPSALDFVPPDSEPVKVTNNDSWWTLAELPGPKALGLRAIDLCFFNFKTRKPAEINWYLRNKVGCRSQTNDQENYKFSHADTPGIIHVPKVGVVPHPIDLPKPPLEPDTIRSDIWFGGAAKYSLQLGPGGLDIIKGRLVNVGSFARHGGEADFSAPGFSFSAQVGRFGLGVGGGLGSMIVIATGVEKAEQLRGFSKTEADWNLSLGGKLKGIINGAKLFSLGKIAAKIASNRIAKHAVSLDPESYIELQKALAAFLESNGIATKSDKPELLLIDTPVAVGLEVSLFMGQLQVTAVNPV